MKDDEAYLYQRGCKIVGGPYDGTFQKIDVRREYINLADPMPKIAAIGDSDVIALTGTRIAGLKCTSQMYRQKQIVNGSSISYQYHLVETQK